MPQGILPEASDFEIHNSQFIDNSHNDNSRTTNVNPQNISSSVAVNTFQTIHAHSPTINNTQHVNDGGISGFVRLLGASNTDALHDSSARDPPPRCHPGTRYEYIDKIVAWGVNSAGRKHRIVWIHGPAGVGKSAVAQSCAEELAKKGKLGAAFFFSRPNSRDKPDYLFTTISYQLAVKDQTWRQILDTMIHNDPSLLNKSIRQQFQDLILTPLAELRARGEDVKELVIIIDGLDECVSNRAQCDIVEIVGKSMQDQTTPLLWIFVSRPEAHIEAAFTSPHISQLSIHIEIPVSRRVDREITKFLTDELKNVQRKHSLPDLWPSERDIGTLVNLSAGLFIYTDTVVRFIKDDDSPGPDDQLQAVLALAGRSANEKETHPLSELDFFYHLLMLRVPQKILPTSLKILLTTTFNNGTEIPINAAVLGLSNAQFRNACRPLHSVLKLEIENKRQPPRIHFYHASFMDFLQDPRRSRKFCIKSDCAMTLRRELCEKLSMVHVKGSCESINTLSTWEPGLRGPKVYSHMVEVFFILCQSIPLDPEMLTALTKFDYNMILVLWDTSRYSTPYYHRHEIYIDQFLQNVPENFHTKIIRRYSQPFYHTTFLSKPVNAEWIQPYILGYGNNKVLCWKGKEGGSYLQRYPSSPVSSMVKFIKTKIAGSREGVDSPRASETSDWAPDDASDVH